MRALHTGIDLRAGGHIDASGNGPAARGNDVAGRALRARLIDIPDGDGGTVACQTLGSCETDAGGPTRDDCILAG